MYNAPPGVIKEKHYSELIQDIKLMSSQNSTSNSVEKIVPNKTKEINPKSFISKNIEINEYAKKVNLYNDYTKIIEFTDKIKTPKNPFLLQNNNSIHLKNKEENFYLKNDFNKSNNNNKTIKSYVSPSFDYNFKNSHKNNNIKLNIKNNNSIPIKLQNSRIKNRYKSKDKTSKKNFYNSSNEVKGFPLPYKAMDSIKTKKNNSLNKKNNEKNNKKKINFNINYNQNIQKYVSFTPGPFRKASFIKNIVSESTDFEENKRKEDIKTIFDREFNRKMRPKKTKIRKSMQNNNNSCLLIRISRNIKTEEDKSIKNSQSQKTLNKNKISKNVFKLLNSYNQKQHANNNNKSDLSYDKYHSVLKQKIAKLNSEIQNLKNEEKNLSYLLINYQEKEKECNDIRKIREEIEKYKIIIEKSTKDCEEYALEIQQIKKMLGEECNNSKNNIFKNASKYNNIKSD